MAQHRPTDSARSRATKPSAGGAGARAGEGPRHGLGDRAPLLAPGPARATTTAGARSTRRPARNGWPRRRRSSRSGSSRSSPSNDSPDLSFDLSINPYRGCEHGCIYCFARPTHSYLDLSPGLDFETKIIAKVNAAERLRESLRAAAPTSRRSINIGSATDAYQPVERKLGITRAVIEVLAECAHPFSLVTKSSGVERDLDLVAPMAARGLVAVYVSVTSLDPALARILEPRAAAPHRRLRTIEALAGPACRWA